MKLAYLVCAHKHPHQLARMIDALRGQDILFFIHIDAKVDENPFRKLLSGDNIFWCKNRAQVNWGGFSQVQAWMNLLQEAVQHPVDYFINLSGQDYPLRNATTIQDFFTTAEEQSFIEYFPLPHPGWIDGGLKRLNGYYYNDQTIALLRRIQFKLGDYRGLRQFPKTLKPYGGGAWFAFPKQVVDYILTSTKENKALWKHLHLSLGPDELFFQTVLFNSPFATQLVNDHLRCIQWQNGSANPEIFTQANFEELRVSDKLFARKFDSTMDATVLDQIDQHILS